MGVNISTSGVVNNVNTILSLIQRLNPVVAALPEVIGLIEAAISAFSNEDKHAVKTAYQEKMLATDAAHAETQKALTEEAAVVQGAKDADEAPKGGAL